MLSTHRQVFSLLSPTLQSNNLQRALPHKFRRKQRSWGPLLIRTSTEFLISSREETLNLIEKTSQFLTKKLESTSSCRINSPSKINQLHSIQTRLHPAQTLNLLFPRISSLILRVPLRRTMIKNSQKRFNLQRKLKKTN